MSGTSTRRYFLTKVDGLQIELEEARETLQAIIRGEADSIMVDGAEGARVFTLRDAHHPYRVLVETMNEGAVTLTADADILYSNSSFARIVDAPLEKVLGSSLLDYIAPADAAPLRALLKNGLERQAKAELQVVTSAGRFVPVYFSVSPTAWKRRRHPWWPPTSARKGRPSASSWRASTRRSALSIRVSALLSRTPRPSGCSAASATS